VSIRFISNFTSLMSFQSLFDETTSEPVTLNEQSHQAAGRVANKYRR
jgi:hypothetical protein